MPALISARHVCLQRAGKEILHDVSLEVHAGDFITIVGPNGAGKTMLLKCLLGLEAPTRGTVELAAGVRLAYVPQRFTADSTLPITAQRFLKLNQARIEEIELQEIAVRTDIAQQLQKPLHVLSGGEMQRVLLARALLRKPQVLVLDEPAQNLDISGQLAFYKLVQRVVAEGGLSVLMVSHDLHMVMASTTQVVCLYRHICCSGAPHAVTKDPEFIKLFGQDMAQMLAVYHHAHAHEHTHEHVHDHAH